MIVKVKKLFRGHTSVRNYLVQRCINRGEDLVIVVGAVQMTVPLSKVKSAYQIHKKKFSSKYNRGQKYELIDFYFIPDKAK